MDKIGIYITSYNRHKMLMKLIDQLIEQGENINYHITVFDDKSNDILFSNNPRLIFIKNDEHRGKKLYWKTWNEMFSLAAIRNDDYSIFLPDDVEICDNFFQLAIDKLEFIKSLDKNFICLSILTDERRKLALHSCWTGKQSKMQHGEILSHFNDCCFICDRTFFEALDYTVEEVPLTRWKRDETLSSGVGRQISLRLMNKELNMYHCFDSLVSHGEHESLMNPDERKTNPLISKI